MKFEQIYKQCCKKLDKKKNKRKNLIGYLRHKKEKC